MSDLPEVKKRDYPLRRGSEYHIEVDGKELVLPSVTYILGQTLPKPELVFWAARTAAKRALEDPSLSVEEAASAIYKTKMSAADKGKLIHSWAEAYARGNPPDIESVPPEFIPYANAIATFFETEDIKPRELDGYPLIEFTVFNITEGYAGTCDFANSHIFDWKTGKGVYDEGHLQQIAYLNAEFIYIPAKDGRTKPKVLPMPKMDGAYLIHLRNDGKYSKIQVSGDFEDFKTVLNMYHMLKKRRGGE